MKTKTPLVLRIEIGLFYGALAGFSLGIAFQQIVLHLFAIFLLAVGAIYGLSVGTLFQKGRRAAVLFFLVSLLCAALGQISFPTDEPARIHWAIASFWVVAPAVVARANWKTLYWTMICMSVPGMIYSVFWLLRPDEIQWAFKNGFNHYPRAFGFVTNPITYAEGMVIMACWSMARLNYGNTTTKERRFILVHLVMSLAIILFSRVRSGLVGFVVLFLLNAFMSPRFRKVGIGIAIGIPVLFLLNTAIFGFNTESLQERLTLMRDSVELFSDNPVFGIGPNKHGEEIEGVGLMPEHPHNTLLGIATENGLVGLLAYLIFMISLARQLWVVYTHHSDRDDPLTWVGRALLCSFVTYHVFGLFDYNFADTELLIIHALQWGILSQLAQNHCKKHRSGSPQQGG